VISSIARIFGTGYALVTGASRREEKKTGKFDLVKMPLRGIIYQTMDFPVFFFSKLGFACAKATA
jgi:hypothetical protein